ncbi:MAG: methyltransferase domain-containing protein [Planctomycetes bacterium]|nr:methyltransferase domain-containing protein [Planctomycetota bacterium]
MNKSVARKVVEANRRVFDAKDFDRYETNPSIFEASRQAEIERVLATAAPSRERMLDVGCGTGNVLRLARPVFRECWGVDLSPKLLGELDRRYPGFLLSAAQADLLPFRDGRFDLVTMYGVLHHLVDHLPVFQACRRVLRPGGVLYADHDPNYFFGRFYHLYYRLRHLDRPGFGTEDAEMSEWHHTRTGGLNPFVLRDLLLRAGFRDVEVRFRITTNPALPFPFRIVRAMMRAIAKVVPLKSLYTHFWMLART